MCSVSLANLTDIIKAEYSLTDENILLITKVSNILIGNDKDVRRLENGKEAELVPLKITNQTKDCWFNNCGLVPEVYLEPSRTPMMELFRKISYG